MAAEIGLLFSSSLGGTLRGEAKAQKCASVEGRERETERRKGKFERRSTTDLVRKADSVEEAEGRFGRREWWMAMMAKPATVLIKDTGGEMDSSPRQKYANESN